MATTLGPDMMVSAAHHDGRVHNPRHLSIPILGDTTGLPEPELDMRQSSPQYQAPPPNPHFVFPARPASMSAPSSYSRATGRRPRSAIETHEKPFGADRTCDSRSPGSPALPNFSFNPGASLSPISITPTTDSFLSPPLSPKSPRQASSRAAGHKRGGSEFVGGDYRSGNARVEVLSSSPTRSEGGMTEAQLLPVDHRPSRGPAHRHVHRRSAAMSSHDLSGITGISPQSRSPKMIAVRGDSAPSSPSLEVNQHFSFPIMYDGGSTKLEAQDARRKSDTEVGPTAQSPEPARAAQRRSFNRVGFSDTLEFIPRPLSLVSSETSSITIRPGHSVSNSISSMISLSNSVIEEKDEQFAPLAPSPSHVTSEFRPSTAEAVLERTESSQAADPIGIPRRRGSLPLITEAPLPSPVAISSPEPSPTKVLKRWSFFGLEPFVGSHSPTRSRPVSASSSEAPKIATPTSSSSEHVSGSSTDVLAADSCAQKPACRKPSKKQKKVKTWAGSILARKPKPRYGKGKKTSRRAPTPPPLGRPEDDEESGDDSADTKSEPAEMPRVFIEELDHDQGGADTWKPPRPATEEDTSYPMIDLDAALGPFNTPLPRNYEWEAAQKAGGLVKRQLHSAAGMSRFVGPGMHYVHHQRAQSSPEMAPFEARRGIHKFGSTSTMADVFEEDEEDDEVDSDVSRESGKSTPQVELPGQKGSETSSVNGYFASSSSVEKIAGGDVNVTTSRGVKRKGSDLEDEKKSLHSASMKSQGSLCSLQEQVIPEEPSNYPFRAVEFGRQADRNVSDSPTASSPMSPNGKELAPVDIDPLNLQSNSLAPISPYSVAPSSSFPSPRSPVSYDANIISTAPSSVADDTFQSLLMGEPGPEVRLSIDIPSLTSSNSTMTRESVSAHQTIPPPRTQGPRERPMSASFGGRRGSLASLSRLISSSHGERSKLSMEVSYNSDGEKKPKGGKGKRFSRMMQFWKPKENAEA